jgi:hypothetical protein
MSNVVILIRGYTSFIFKCSKLDQERISLLDFINKSHNLSSINKIKSVLVNTSSTIARHISNSNMYEKRMELISQVQCNNPSMLHF